MTTEQKAKAYDEALKDMRVIYPNLRGDAKLAVEHAFPQLAESEDERIRKRLIEYFEGFLLGKVNVKWEGLCVEGILAWLEKQKEQKPEWSEEDEEILDGLISLYSNTYSGEKWPWKKGGYITYGDVVNFLKSLRPSWKPTKEQMAALQTAYECLSTGSSPENVRLSDNLRRLFNQLKKL